MTPDDARKARLAARFVVARLAARFVVAGTVLYAAIDTWLVFARPQFSFLHNAESDYGSTGPWAWLMDVNFLVRCAIGLAGVVAIVLAVRGAKSGGLGVGTALLAVWAVTSGLLAFFPDDPVGTRVHGPGKVHLLLAAVAFVAVAAGAIVTSHALRSRSRWQWARRPLLALSWGAIVPVLALGSVHFARHSLGGLYEKLFLAAELSWFVVAVAPIALDGFGLERPAPLAKVNGP
ncbi:MAG TPA: DUF998 domain-containing protein [Acidimicrobiales bacterium]|nr:DUF998 domain-containing protein [Acidimicrobiales bacterium]